MGSACKDGEVSIRYDNQTGEVGETGKDGGWRWREDPWLAAELVGEGCKGKRRGEDTAGEAVDSSIQEEARR